MHPETPARDRTPVIFRFDDPSPVSSRSLEERVLGIMRRHGVPLTAGFIPAHCSGTQTITLVDSDLSVWKEAHASGLVEICQHGWLHAANRLQPNPSEFAGLPFAAQSEMICLGKQAVEAAFGVPVAGFVPPFNTLDSATVAALTSNGFAYISGGLVPPFRGVSPIALLPQTCHLPQLRDALAEARRLPYKRPIIVVAFHHYDFVESGSARPLIDLPRFESLIAWLTGESVWIATLDQLATSHRVDDAWLRVAAWNIRSRLHWRLRALLPQLSLPASQFSAVSRVNAAV